MAEDFSVVGRILVGPQGHIALPLGQDRKVWMYDADGRRIATVGRQGAGPGEFQTLGGAGWAADTLWVHDRLNNRVTYVAPDGAISGMEPLPAPLRLIETDGTARELLIFSPLGIHADGSMTGNGRYMIPEEARVSRNFFLRVTAAGEAERGPPLEGPPDLYQRRQAIARELMPTVYPPVTGFRIGLDGTFWIDLRETGEGRVTLVLDRNGDPIGSVRVPGSAVIRQASTTHVWVTETDAFDLASVVRYRVEGLPCEPRGCGG